VHHDGVEAVKWIRAMVLRPHLPAGLLQSKRPYIIGSGSVNADAPSVEEPGLADPVCFVSFWTLLTSHAR
jgi:hypothetical protein